MFSASPREVDFALLSLPAFPDSRGRLNTRVMITAVTGEPSEGRDQFRRQLYTAGIDLETALKNFAAATDNVKKAAGGLGVEDIAAFIFYCD